MIFSNGRELASTALRDAFGNCRTGGLIFGRPVRVIDPALRDLGERLHALVG